MAKYYKTRGAKYDYIRLMVRQRNGGIGLKRVYPKDLTTRRLIKLLKEIIVFGGGIFPEVEEENGYTLIKEAIKRLNRLAKIEC